MSLAQKIDIFGIDSIAFFDRVTYLPFGRLQVLQGSSLVITGKLVENNGGSNPFPWNAQPGKQDATLNIKSTEYPNFVYQLFGGGTPTENAADADGYVSTPVNRQGTSVIKATTGIATVLALVGSEANLKFGRYVIKAISASTIQIYISADTDFTRGADVAYQSDSMDVLAAATTIATTVENDQTALGLKLTGGSATTAFVVGDTATFEVRPKNSQNMTVDLGGPALTFPEFRAIVMAKRKSTGELFECEIHKAVGSGLPVNFDEDKFSAWDVKCTVLKDPNEAGIARLRRVTPLTPA